MNYKDDYQILGVSEAADENILKRAYQLALKFLPDKNPSHLQAKEKINLKTRVGVETTMTVLDDKIYTPASPTWQTIYILHETLLANTNTHEKLLNRS